MVTKGYGLSISDINESTPKELRTYEKAFKLAEEYRDCEMWSQGLYNFKAFSVVIEGLASSFSGKRTNASYFNKPLYILEREKDRELTEEEKNEQINKIFMTLDIMQHNFNMTHKDN